MPDIARLEKALGHQFQDKSLLQLALTHRSVSGRNNERLEFLGDSILNHIIAHALFRRFSDAKEGELSRMRASLVKGVTLTEVATELDLGDHLTLGSGERKSGGHRRASILADSLEAVFGAVLLDAGFDACNECVLALFSDRLREVSAQDSDKDAKTRLQEYLQGRGSPLPDYVLVATEGEAHAQQFSVDCRVSKPSMSARGEGSSRRKAEQSAAEEILQQLDSSV